MIRRPPQPTRTDPLFPCPPLFRATHARRQRLLAGHLEEADVAGAPHVGAAAELGRIGLAATRGIAAAHRQHAHLVAVLLAEEGERAGLDRLFRRPEAGLASGRAHVLTPVTHEHLASRLPLE